MVKNPVEYRKDWDKKPFPPSKATEGAGDKGSQTPAPKIESNVGEQFFTGAGANINPPEIGQDSVKPIGVPNENLPVANVKDNVDEEFFTGVGQNIEPPEIGKFPPVSKQETEN